jgi:uncharacterized membrane protein
LTGGMSSTTAPGPEYSRAFETLVEDPNDLVGLLAYALYKQTIREAVCVGRPVLPPSHRFPATTERAAYRGDAERRLQSFAAAATDEATPDIIARGVGLAVEAAKIELIQTVYRRTHFLSAIGVNLAAWVITLAITVLLLVTVYLPSWQSNLVDRIKAAQAPPPAPGQTSAPLPHQ